MKQSTNSVNWESKIKFFSKFLGFDQEDIEDTLDTSIKTDTTRKPSKGIKIMNDSLLSYSMLLFPNEHRQNEKKWQSYLNISFDSCLKSDILSLTMEGTYCPQKIMPWLAQNQQNNNPKLFNLRRLQLNHSMKKHNPYRLQKISPSLFSLSKSINQGLFQLLGTFLITRQDLDVSQLLVNIGSTIYFYLGDTPVMAYNLLSYFSCSSTYLYFLTRDIQGIHNAVHAICKNIRKNCSSTSFLLKASICLEQFVRTWIDNFWLSFSDNGTLFREKLLYYLLINKLSLESISRVCEALIVSLSRMINKGVKEKTYYTLANPKFFIDEELFEEYLFSQQ